MTKNLIFSAIALLAFAAAGSAQSGKDTFSGVDFANRTYTTSTCSKDIGMAKTVTVANGAFKDEENYFNLIDTPVFGMLGGKSVAIVHGMCGGNGGNFSNSEVYVFTMVKGKAVEIGRVDTPIFTRDYKKTYKSGFVVGFESAKIEGGNLKVTAYTDGSNASPKWKSTLTYKLAAGKLMVTGRPVRAENKY